MNLKKIFPYLIAILSFIIISLAYFSPILEGKKLFQSDIAQFRGMSKEIKDFRITYGEEPYWTDRAFGGMPSYQLSAYYPHDYIKKLDSLLRFLPRPADYLFLYFFGFFILLMVLKTEWKLAIIGALAFGFSTYFIIILGVGHNAKAHAIAYMPLVLAGILMVFQKRYLPGFVLTSIAMALEINASHPQMTYYLLLMVFIFGIVYLINAIQKNELPDFFKNIGILLVAVFLAVGVNATSLLATKEYANHSTRSKSELTITPDGKTKENTTTGLSKDYITEYSYGLLETFDLFIPRFMGGSNNENLGKDSHIYKFLKDKAGRKQASRFSENAPMYWGDQPIVAAPAYIGAVIIFLFILGLFLVDNKLKKWLVVATLFSIFLSWGKNFSFLTDLFINYVPLYNKFRAVSSIQVITELATPLLGILALKEIFNSTVNNDKKLEAIKKSFFIVGGIALFFTILGTSLFAFESFRDAGYEKMLKGFLEVIIQDRKSIFFKDSLRSFFLVILTALPLWFYVKGKINKNLVYVAMLLLVLFDLVTVDKRYVNNDDFISKSKLERPFPKTQIDAEILKDKSHYRVLNFMVNPMNDGSTSYYFNSIGGYHAAKPRRYQELYTYQIAKNNFDVLNMLNTKYIIYPDDNNSANVQVNPDANGNAWFVHNIKFAKTPDEEIKALDSINTKETAIVNTEFKDLIKKSTFQNDSTATIQLTKYKANELTYKSNSKTEQLAVFSEMYYKDGWNAYLDGNLTKHFRVNYVLRAMLVPPGEHQIVFKFEPQIIKKGKTITLVSYVLLILIPLGWYFKEKKTNK